MRPVLVVALLFALLPLAPSRKGGVETRVRYYPDGTLQERAEALVAQGGKLVYHGRFQGYSSKGALVTEGRYEHGVMEGHWRHWRENGALQGEGAYRSGTCEFTQYYPDGTVQARGPMTGNLRRGIWTEWYPGGQIKMRGEIVDEKQHGPWTFWTDTMPPREIHNEYDHGKLLP